MGSRRTQLARHSCRALSAAFSYPTAYCPDRRLPLPLATASLANSRSLKQSPTMRRLFLIRHAKAEPSVGPRRLRARADRARPGRRAPCRGSPRGARHAPRHSHSFGRAAHQADGGDLRLRVAAARRSFRKRPRLYDATQGMLFARARALSDAQASVGFVGHNPGIGELAVSLAGFGAYPELRRMAAKYPTSPWPRSTFRLKPGTTSSARPRCSPCS